MRKLFLTAACVILAASAVAQDALTIKLVDGDRRTTLRYTTPDAKGRVGGFGIFTVVKGYASLAGKTADVRSRTDSPSFEFFLNSAANPKNEVQLVKFDIKSKSREIRLSKARAGDSSIGFPQDHTVPVTIEEIETRSGFTQWRMKPQSPLRRGGEYAVVRGRGMYFDFGVDK
jgi:hypothetical protein